MRKSYIANDKEAALLHSGQQTAIIVPMIIQPTPNKINSGNFDFEFVLGKEYHSANNVTIQDFNTQFVGILDFSPYALHHPVYVRECWNGIKDEFGKVIGYLHKGNCKTQFSTEEADFMNSVHWKSPATMPKEAASTWFVPVEVQAVRVQDIAEEQAHYLNIRAITKDNITCKYGLCDDDGFPYGFGWSWGEFTNTISEALAKYIAQKLGQKAWDENHFVWYYKIQKHA